MEAKELQDLIDTADCNAEVNFTRTNGSQSVLGWARKLIEISFKAGYEQGLEEAPHIKNQCKMSYQAGMEEEHKKRRNHDNRELSPRRV